MHACTGVGGTIHIHTQLAVSSGIIYIFTHSHIHTHVCTHTYIPTYTYACMHRWRYHSHSQTTRRSKWCTVSSSTTWARPTRQPFSPSTASPLRPSSLLVCARACVCVLCACVCCVCVLRVRACVNARPFVYDFEAFMTLSMSPLRPSFLLVCACVACVFACECQCVRA